MFIGGDVLLYECEGEKEKVSQTQMDTVMILNYSQ